ncbi:MAG: hypothetical protein K2O24_09210 [Muribaculaceae bacterium]|nr:hypothetical protein [Muribaculaceae bacterium]
MKVIIYNLLHDHLYLHVVLISVCVAGIIVAMAVDLFFGIKKAKALGHATTSTGYKKTCEKGRKYFMPFAVLMMIDIIGCIILPAPFFVMIWSAWCIFCEFKSVREKSWTKAELRKAEKTMSIIIENKDDIAKMVAEMVLGCKHEATEIKQKETTLIKATTE